MSFALLTLRILNSRQSEPPREIAYAMWFPFGLTKTSGTETVPSFDSALGFRRRRGLASRSRVV